MSHNADEICHYTTQYEYICAYQNSDGNWVRDESLECPEMIVYYKTDSVASYDDYEGWFYPSGLVKPVDPNVPLEP